MAERRRVAWLVPQLLEGSGGHRTIFQNIEALADAGYVSHVYLESAPPGRGRSALRRTRDAIAGYFGPTSANVHLGFDVDRPVDLVFATVWYSAAVVRDLQQECVKAYFIQDYEALFNPMGDGYLFAENSYRYGLKPVTIGRWLSRKMLHDFGTPARFFDFCADRTIYRPQSVRHRRERAVCFISQPEKPRRCTRLGLEALGVVKHLRPDAKIIIYGSRTDPENIWFEHENRGLLSVHDCADLYRRCQVGLCISSSNPSRVPFEMMAAGLPVVDVFRENNLYDMPDEAALLADSNPEAIARAIVDLLDNEEQRQRMSEFGIDFMAPRTLEHGFRQFVEAVDGMFQPGYGEATAIDRCYRNDPIRADGYRTRYVQPRPPARNEPKRTFAQRVKSRLAKTARVLATGQY